MLTYIFNGTQQEKSYLVLLRALRISRRHTWVLTVFAKSHDNENLRPNPIPVNFNFILWALVSNSGILRQGFQILLN